MSMRFLCVQYVLLVTLLLAPACTGRFHTSVDLLQVQRKTSTLTTHDFEVLITRTRTLSPLIVQFDQFALDNDAHATKVEITSQNAVVLKQNSTYIRHNATYHVRVHTNPDVTERPAFAICIVGFGCPRQCSQQFGYYPSRGTTITPHTFPFNGKKLALFPESMDLQLHSFHSTLTNYAHVDTIRWEFTVSIGHDVPCNVSVHMPSCNCIVETEGTQTVVRTQTVIGTAVGVDIGTAVTAPIGAATYSVQADVYTIAYNLTAVLQNSQERLLPQGNKLDLYVHGSNAQQLTLQATFPVMLLCHNSMPTPTAVSVTYFSGGTSWLEAVIPLRKARMFTGSTALPGDPVHVHVRGNIIAKPQELTYDASRVAWVARWTNNSDIACLNTGAITLVHRPVYYTDTEVVHSGSEETTPLNTVLLQTHVSFSCMGAYFGIGIVNLWDGDKLNCFGTGISSLALFNANVNFTMTVQPTAAYLAGAPCSVHAWTRNVNVTDFAVVQGTSFSFVADIPPVAEPATVILKMCTGAGCSSEKFTSQLTASMANPSRTLLTDTINTDEYLNSEYPYPVQFVASSAHILFAQNPNNNINPFSNNRELIDFGPAAHYEVLARSTEGAHTLNMRCDVVASTSTTKTVGCGARNHSEVKEPDLKTGNYRIDLPLNHEQYGLVRDCSGQNYVRITTPLEFTLFRGASLWAADVDLQAKVDSAAAAAAASAAAAQTPASAVDKTKKSQEDTTAAAAVAGAVGAAVTAGVAGVGMLLQVVL